MQGTRRIETLAALALATMFSGCKVGPDYVEPEVTLDDEWRSAIVSEMSAEAPDITMWWESLGDPLLTDLIHRAADANLDLQVAYFRIVEARATLGIAEGALYPSLTASGQFQRLKISDNSFLGQALGGSSAQNLWDAGLSSAWELDLFGRIRRNVEASSASFQATIEEYRDVQVVLFAEIALNYIDARAVQLRLAFAKQNAAAQRESLELTRDRFESGLTSALDVAQAEQNLAQTESSIPPLEIALNNAENRLAVLLGMQPGALHEELAAAEGVLPVIPPGMIVGVPAELLRRRPDVRRAERVLAAQTALIGVTKADLYPTFSITGAVSTVATTFSGLGDSGSLEWSIVPGFRWDLFAGGAIRSNIEAQEARMEQALVAYQQTILLALEEVQDALVGLDQERVRRDRLTEAAAASQRAVDLVRTQYLSGLTNFQNLLDTQRSLFQQQDALADSQGRVVQNLILLNRALGGGWSEGAPPPAPDDVAAEEDMKP